MGFLPGYESGVPRATMHCPPLARHLCVTAWAAILSPYDTRFYDVMGLGAFFPVHPWHATRVSLPGQRFRAHMIPASMT